MPANRAVTQMRVCILVVLLAVFSAGVEAFISSFKHTRKHAISQMPVLMTKPDLFSGESFDISTYLS